MEDEQFGVLRRQVFLGGPIELLFGSGTSEIYMFRQGVRTVFMRLGWMSLFGILNAFIIMLPTISDAVSVAAEISVFNRFIETFKLPK